MGGSIKVGVIAHGSFNNLTLFCLSMNKRVPGVFNLGVGSYS